MYANCQSTRWISPLRITSKKHVGRRKTDVVFGNRTYVLVVLVRRKGSWISSPKVYFTFQYESLPGIPLRICVFFFARSWFRYDLRRLVEFYCSIRVHFPNSMYRSAAIRRWLISLGNTTRVWSWRSGAEACN